VIKSYGLRVASYGLRGKRQNTLEDTSYTLRVAGYRLETKHVILEMDCRVRSSGKDNKGLF